jgi:LmbE family N-acetylglucosaminyl deacetylase
MPKQQHHQYPLKADLTCRATLSPDGELRLESPMPDASPALYSWWLELDYRAGSRWKLPGVEVRHNDNAVFTQYFEPGQCGRRLLNLAGVPALNGLRLHSLACSLQTEARLLGFAVPNLASGPLLVVAPHPDDAELAAYGLYRHFHQQAWIVTLTAGERQKQLHKQYWPGLDTQAGEASLRKGLVRSWNSITTPMLAGVPAERSVMLGYFNDTLPSLLEQPAAVVPSRDAPELVPARFRQWNAVALASGPSAQNCGTHLVEDLVGLLRQIRPSTLMVTHPEVDPHHDHRAAAALCARALAASGHQPEQVLLYANHLKGVRGFPRGPAHAAAGVWPWQQPGSRFGPWRLYSHYLPFHIQQEKAVALDSMHDLRAHTGLGKQARRWWRRRLSGVPMAGWKDYGEHDYFQTHIKAQEVFAVVSATDFMTALLE